MDHNISHDILEPIAIIGIDCLFPKSLGLQAYWQLIYQGRDGITDIPDTHWSLADYYDADPKRPDHTYCRRGGFLPPIDFDPTEFGIPPNTLEATDTSQLLALITAKGALTDAGYGSAKGFDHSRTSVILGVTGTQELVIPLGARLGFPHWRRALQRADIEPDRIDSIINDISNAYVSWQENSFPGLLGNVVAGRICNRLDLGGTNCVVDAACASSMSALHLALMELSAGRSDMVVSGGVDTLNDIFMHMCFSKTHILSPSGDIRPFSIDADGTILGEGIGLLVLKRLTDAEKDADRIYAVIKGLGSSSDGKSQSIYAPRQDGQARALRMAYRQADIDPSTVALVEAHGTGTRVGDRVEFEALQQVYGAATPQQPWCALGSVKSMIGHTKAAAGAAGLIKTALALHHKVLPPTLKVDAPDPDLDLSASAFYLNTISRPWVSRADHPRRAGVSAFGFGGSNFHAVLEEYQPRKADIVWNECVEILAVSAASPQRLHERTQKLADDLRTTDHNPAASARIMAQSRSDFDHQAPYRLLGVVDQRNDPQAGPTIAMKALANLETLDPETDWHDDGIFYGGSLPPTPFALVFPGQGSQYPGMGRDFVCRFPAAFGILDRMSNRFANAGHLVDTIYPHFPGRANDQKRQMQALTRTDFAQPAIGAISLGMFQVLQQFGVQPDATCGHSYGELTALCAANWITVDAFIRLSIARGACMANVNTGQTSEPGAMLAVKAPLPQIEALIEGLPVILANRNSPNQGVLSGPANAIAQANARLREKGLRCVKLPVAAAFHSAMMTGASATFGHAIAKETISPTATPVYSNVSAHPYPLDPEEAARLLGRQMLSPVDFENEVKHLFAAGVRKFIEVGPGNVLSRLIGEILHDQSIETLALDQKSSAAPALLTLAQVFCSLAATGHPITLSKWAPVTTPDRQTRMHVELTGANYRRPTSATSASAAHAPAKQPDTISAARQAPTATHHTSPPTPTRARKPASLTLNNSEAKHMDKSTSQKNFVPQAFAAIQENLQSLQKLQQQTAEAHQKFLETQTQASRALEAMFASTQRLAEASAGLSPESMRSPGRHAASDHAVEPPASMPNSANSAAQAPQMALNPAETEVPPSISAPPEPDDQAETPGNEQTAPVAKTDNGLAQVLLKIVSELTGYPPEMLGLDMDIEADLGIDSIKRVEILSTLEEQIPDLPAVTPEDMGTLKTLGQIIEYLAQNRFTPEIPAAQSTAPSDAPASDAQAASRPLASPAEQNPDQRIEHRLLSIVSDLTGYPPEMLGLDMDIEADLGIDSIKRVEILSTLEEQMPDLPAVTPEDMGTLKTLGQIIGHLTRSTSKQATASSDVIPLAPISTGLQDVSGIGHTDIETSQVPPDWPDSPPRLRIKPIEASRQPEQQLKLADDRKLYVLDDTSGFSNAVANALVHLNLDADVIAADTINQQVPSDLGGLIIIPDAALMMKTQWHPEDGMFLKLAFRLAQKAAPTLLAAAEHGGALLATITRLDGAFGFKTGFDTNPLMGGLAGLTKTAAMEWPTVTCRALDIAADWQDLEAAARAVAQEIHCAASAGPVEVGLDQNTRLVLKPEPEPYPPLDRADSPLGPGDVVVVTGGAKGVTAASLYELARRSQATFILMGRSPAPTPEPEWLSGRDHEHAVKQAIMQHAFDDRLPTPRELEQAYRMQQSNRDIKATIADLKNTGAQVAYLSVDVCDARLVETALARVRRTHGPIKGIVHGAGILADRLISDKTPDQFNHVFDTKVAGLHALLKATQSDDLRQIVLYSSVAARTGNQGQVDYAMANEALNKIAWHEASRRADCNVIAINWGPWDGGMVTPSLKKEFQRHNIALIEQQEGARCLFREMAANHAGSAEIVIGAMMQDATLTDPPVKNSNRLALSFKREIDIETVPVLRSHLLDGKPVVPLALMTEWFGHGALHENPGLRLHGFDDLRVLKGIRLANGKKLIRLMAGKATRNGSAYEVPLELRDGISDGREVIHSNTRAILSDALPQPPAFQMPDQLTSQPYDRSINEIYDKILFHGSDLRGIEAVLSLSSGGMVARVAAAPEPEQWIRNPLRTKWIGDPLALDCAFQMASLWCYEQIGSVSLPSFCASYRQYAHRFPSQGLVAVLQVTARTERKIKADITFLDATESVVAQITGYEAVMDTSLIKAFKPQLAASA